MRPCDDVTVAIRNVYIYMKLNMLATIDGMSLCNFVCVLGLARHEQTMR
jgi:hypothetical protein